MSKSRPYIRAPWGHGFPLRDVEHRALGYAEADILNALWTLGDGWHTTRVIREQTTWLRLRRNELPQSKSNLCVTLNQLVRAGYVEKQGIPHHPGQFRAVVDRATVLHAFMALLQSRLGEYPPCPIT